MNPPSVSKNSDNSHTTQYIIPFSLNLGALLRNEKGSRASAQDTFPMFFPILCLRHVVGCFSIYAHDKTRISYPGVYEHPMREHCAKLASFSSAPRASVVFLLHVVTFV